MKVAIVHDYIKEYGGAERVLEELHKLFPEAPIYTSIYSPEYLGPHRFKFEQMNIKTTFLQYIPFKNKLISPARLIAPIIFRSLDLSSYDVVITSAAGTYTSPNYVGLGLKTTLICYCHTPPRYLYGYKTANDWDSNPLRKFLKIIGMIPMHFLRLLDFKGAQYPDYFIANSEEVKARIEKFYRRDSVVINPPVDLPGVKGIKKGNYYVTGGRMARAKGTDIVIEAFNKNGKKLKVFGKSFAGFGEELEKIAGKNIEFVGEVTDLEKFELMASAKAFISASFDEDFGITPVESMAVGTPVIAYRSGGVKETLIEGKTGVFFDENTPDAINSAVKIFEKEKFSQLNCIKQAEQFSAENFDKKMKQFIERKVENA